MLALRTEIVVDICRSSWKKLAFIFYPKNKFPLVVLYIIDLERIVTIVCNHVTRAKLLKDAKCALVYQLLNVFVTQRLDACLHFHAESESGEIPYSLIGVALRVCVWVQVQVLFHFLF